MVQLEEQKITSTDYDARNNRVSLKVPGEGETTYDPDHGNLVDVQIRPGKSPPVFAGEQARFKAWATGQTGWPMVDALRTMFMVYAAIGVAVGFGDLRGREVLRDVDTVGLRVDIHDLGRRGRRMARSARVARERGSIPRGERAEAARARYR